MATTGKCAIASLVPALRFLTGTNESIATLWDLATGKPMAHLKNDTAVRFAAFSQDGHIVFTNSSKGIQRWDATTGKPRGPLLSCSEHGYFILSPDGGTLLTCDHDLWDIAKGKRIGEPLKLPDGSRGMPGAFFSPDGRSIVTRSNSGFHIWDVASRKRLWDVAARQPLRSLGPSDTQMVFAADRKSVVSTHLGKLQRREASTGKLIDEPFSWPQPVTRASFSADAKTMVGILKGNSAQLWDAETGERRGEPFDLGDDREPWSIVLAPNNRFFVTAHMDGNLRVWDLATQKLLGAPMPHPPGYLRLSVTRGPFSLTTGIVDFAISPDSRTILSWNMQKIFLWNAATGLPVGKPFEVPDGIGTVAFLPNSLGVLIGSPRSKGVIQVWKYRCPSPAMPSESLFGYRC